MKRALVFASVALAAGSALAGAPERAPLPLAAGTVPAPIPNDGIDDSAGIEALLEAGGEVDLDPGVYDVMRPIRVIVTSDLSLRGRGAILIAHEIDGDLLSLDAGPGTGYGHNISVHDIAFDISRSLNSTVIPYVWMHPPARPGTARTADALSIRGLWGGRSRFGRVEIQRIAVYGATGGWATADWPDAGGDSGVFIEGGREMIVERSSFLATRDAAVYVSGKGDVETSAQIAGNLVVRSSVGITSKRGVDRVTFARNWVEGGVLGLSVLDLDGTQITREFGDCHNFTTAETAIRLENVSVSWACQGPVRRPDEPDRG